jgi:hypothetical protein
MPDHVLGDRGLRHRDSNLQQFSVNAGSSPSEGWRGSFSGSDSELLETHTFVLQAVPTKESILIEIVSFTESRDR